MDPIFLYDHWDFASQNILQKLKLSNKKSKFWRNLTVPPELRTTYIFKRLIN